MAEYQSKLEKKGPCEFCGGPFGECLEGRGGFLPEWVCKKRPSYDQLAAKVAEQTLQLATDKEIIEDLTAEVEKLANSTIPGIAELQARLERHEQMLLRRFNVATLDELEVLLAGRRSTEPAGG